MKSKICRMLGVDFPLFAFSHCRDVVVEVSKAGGFGVLGAVGFTPEQLEIELTWIDKHIDGKPYGVDIVVPENMGARFSNDSTRSALLSEIPDGHREFASSLMSQHDVAPDTSDAYNAWEGSPTGLMPDTGERTMDVAFNHPIRLVVHALGVPPKSLIERAKRSGVPLGALVGSKEHALRQVASGVDVIIAQGTEAGGHCGEVSTMVLVPDVVKAVAPLGDVPVLAAGGIVTGRQMAAAMTMGAAGAWTGSVWLPTIESELSNVMREKMIAASSRDTVRTKASTGKMCRQLKSAWTDAWESDAAPKPLQMPYQPLLTHTVMFPALRSAEKGNDKARALVNYLVGQGIGMIDEVQSSRAVVQAFMEDFADALERMQSLLD